MDLRQLERALSSFAVLDPTHLPVHFCQVFLVVASREGPCTFRDIEDTLNLSTSAVSRTVMAMGQLNRRGQPGFDLLQVAKDPTEGRRYIVTLTARGRALKRQLDAL